MAFIQERPGALSRASGIFLMSLGGIWTAGTTYLLVQLGSYESGYYLLLSPLPVGGAFITYGGYRLKRGKHYNLEKKWTIDMK
jgi:hypothetical protein